MRSDLGVLAAIALVAFGTGCAGARTTVVANHAQVPISLSRAVRDSDGVIVPQERAVKVATFHDRGDAYALFWSLATVTRRKDISKAINRQVAAHGGDAVVNLQVRAVQCGVDFAAVISWLPLWPGCTHVEIVGDIIKVVPAAPLVESQPETPSAARGVTLQATAAGVQP